MFIQTTSRIEKIKHKISCFTINIDSLSKQSIQDKYMEIKKENCKSMIAVIALYFFIV